MLYKMITEKLQFSEVEKYDTLRIRGLELAKYYLPLFESKRIEIDVVENEKPILYGVIYNHLFEGMIIVVNQKFAPKNKNIEVNNWISKKGKPFAPSIFEKVIDSKRVYTMSEFALDEAKLNLNNCTYDGQYFVPVNRSIPVEISYNGIEVTKKENENFKNLYDVDKVFMFMNVPTKGGIIDQIKNYTKFFQLMGKEVNFVCEDYANEDENDLIDLPSIGFDNIYVMSEQDNFKEIFGERSLLFFLQARIAVSFENFYRDHNVIMQYHRNINHATPAIFNQIKRIANKIEVGEVQLLEPNANIKKIFPGYNNIKEFQNYVFANDPANTRKVKDVKNIGIISRLTDADNSKNIDGMHRIIDSLLAIKPNYVFHIYGSGDRESEFIDKHSNVIYHGFEYDKAKIYKDLDLVLLPSLSEAYPLTLVEALLNGIKVVTYNSSNMIDQIVEPEFGEIVELDNEEEFIEAVVGIKKYNRANITNLAQEKFSFNLEQMVEYYSTVNIKHNHQVVKTIYMYDTSIENDKLTLKFFTSGYQVERDTPIINTTIKYKKSIDTDTKYYYSNRTVNFGESLIKLEIDLADISHYDVLRFYKQETKGNIMAVKNACVAIPIKDKGHLVLEDGELRFKAKEEKTLYEISSELQNQKILLFQDRENKASDNGEALYRYAVECSKLTEYQKYFIIEENTPDYYRLLIEGFNVVPRGSEMHKLLYLTSAVIYSSHVKQDIVNPIKDRAYKFYMQGKLVFLQHGIMFDRSDYKYFLNELVAPADAMIISNEYEREIVEDVTNYPAIIKTGLARYDLLKNKDPEEMKYITYFPTWNRHIDMTNFTETIYYEKINEFLTSSTLNSLLEENNLKLKFVLHPEVQKYIEHFKTSKNIEVCPIDEIVFSKLLSNTELLITDASSIFFDAIYQFKPVVIYAPYPTHQDACESYAKDCLYSTVDTQSAIDYIGSQIANNFIIEDKYKTAIEDLFEYTDANNCQRIIEATFTEFNLD